MKRLIILVEGDCEILLMQRLVIPYLYRKGKADGWSIETAKITTNRKLNKKGGNVSYVYLQNDVRRFASQGCTLITTFFDFFRLPIDFPGYTTVGNEVEQVEVALLEALRGEIPSLPEFVPYIQKHEFEALLFSGMEGFELVVDDETLLKEIQLVVNSCVNPEEINGGADTAPSKRLKKFFDYDKTRDSELILEMLGIEVILERCPRFRAWVGCLVRKLSEL